MIGADDLGNFWSCHGGAVECFVEFVDLNL